MLFFSKICNGANNTYKVKRVRTKLFEKKKRGPKIGFLRVIEIYVYLSIYEVNIIKHLRKLLEEFKIPMEIY